jgi:hypothetical protein
MKRKIMVVKPVTPGNESKWPWAHLLMSVIVITKPEVMNVATNLWDMQCCCTMPINSHSCTCRCCILIVLVYTANLCLTRQPVADRDNLGLSIYFQIFFRYRLSNSLWKQNVVKTNLFSWNFESVTGEVHRTLTVSGWSLTLEAWVWSQPLWDIWCTKWQWDRFLSKYFCFPCQYHSINSP